MGITAEEAAKMVTMFDEGATFDEIIAATGRSRAAITNCIYVTYNRPKRGHATGPRRSHGKFVQSRLEPHRVEPGKTKILAHNHAAVVEGRTLYPSRVHDVADRPRALVSGVNNKKIGRMVRKGPWAGMPIFTLTLEERATCPRSCHHWQDCMGNSMNFAMRIRPGRELEQRLEQELGDLLSRNRQGIVVRLHTLGDFYSVGYVRFWRRMLERYPGLHVFGFTARFGCKIGDALVDLTTDMWPRFAMRFSDAPIDVLSTASIRTVEERPPAAVICPAQTGKTRSCGDCGICWHSQKQIAFLQH